MPKNDIGGFFVSLGLNADKNSFETGNKLVDNVANSFNKLIGAARNAAVVLAGTAVATGTVESAAYKTAEKIGISTEALDLWKASAKIAGVNANGLLSAMGSLSNVMGRMRIDGAGLDQFTKKLGELGLVVDKVDIAKMLEMAPDELMTDILRKAQEAAAKTKDTKEKQRISIIVGDVLGEAGQDFFIELQRQGKTIDEFLSGAGRTVFTNAADNQKGANFAVEVNTLRTEIESMTKLLGDAIGGELTKYVKELNQWIQDNGPIIRKTVEDIAKFTGKAVGETVDITGSVVTGGKAVIDLATADNEEAKQAAIKKGQETVEEWESWADQGGAKGALGKYTVVVGKATETAIDFVDGIKDWVADNDPNNGAQKEDKEQKKIFKTELERRFKNKNKDTKLWQSNKLLIPGEDLSTNAIQEYRDVLGDKVAGKYIKLNDGIVRPDGTVTQVAPDDWVFAARNVGDLARAFIPQSFGQATASAPSEYIINQTFNISGGNDMPQIIKEQAYRGTQDGLLQLMNKSSQRLQLMSGIR